MAIEQETPLIIMLCTCKQDDKEMSAKYFPASFEDVQTHGNFEVSLASPVEEVFPKLNLRHLVIKDLAKDKCYEIKHL